MNYTFEKDNSVLSVSFSIDKHEWEHCQEAAYEENKSRFSVKGFRKGMVPKKIIEKMYGENVFIEEAFNHCVSHYYSEFLEKEQDIRPLLDPDISIDGIDENGVTFKAEIIVRPELKLKQYKGIDIPQEIVRVTDAEIDSEIDRVRERTARRVPVETRSIIEGDIVNFDFTGYLDNEKFEGGSAKDFELEIGSKRFIPGFEEQMIGLRGGEEKSLSVTFPDDYHEEKFRSKPVVFKVKVNKIFKKELPEANDEFAKDVSDFDTIADYRDSIKGKIILDRSRNLDSINENKIIDAVAANLEVSIPEKLIEKETDRMLADFEQRLSKQKMKLPDYLQYLNITEEEFKKQRAVDAEKQIRVRFTLEEIIKAEDLSAKDDEVEQAISKRAASEGKTPERFMKSIDRSRLDSIVNEIVIDKLIVFLKANNNLIGIDPQEDAPKSAE